MTTYAYYPSGRPKEVTQPGNDRPSTKFFYDELGRTIRIEDALGHSTHNIYDGVGNLVAIVDARGSGREDEQYRQVMEYNDLNHMISTSDQLGNTTRYEYDLNGNQKKLIDPRIDVMGTSHPETLYEYDEGDRLIKITNAADRVSTYEYNKLDQITIERAQRLLPDGTVITDVTQNEYDRSGRLQWTIDAASDRTEFDYDAVGNLIKITDGRGASSRVEYKYDKRNRVIEQRVGSGSPAVTTTSYHPLGMIREVIDPVLQKTTMTFDDLGFIRTTIVADGSSKPATTTTEYDERGNLIRQVDPRGDFYTTTYTYDRLNRMKSQSGPSGTPSDPKPYTLEFDYDPVGNLIRATDPRGDGLETRHEYDRASRRLRTFDTANLETSFTYDEAGNILTQTSPAVSDEGSRELTFAYDLLGHQLSITDALNNTTCTLMDDRGQPIVLINPRANIQNCSSAAEATQFATRTWYDGMGRKTAEVDAGGNRREWEYDAAGNLTREVDPRTFDARTPGVFETLYDYDNLGFLERSTQSVGPMGNDEVAIHRYQYNAVGHLVKYTDPRGYGYSLEFTYDPLQRVELLKQSVPESQQILTTRTEYDEVGNLVKKTDPRGDFYTLEFEYDALNRRVATTEPTGSAERPGEDARWELIRDEAGNVLEMRDPRGSYYTVTFSYDELGRVERKSVPTGSESQPGEPAVTDYEYFPGGTVKLVTLPFVGQSGERPTIQSRYNRLGLLSSKVDELGAETTFEYDEAGNLKKVVELPLHNEATRTTFYEYDSLDRGIKITDPAGLETSTEYDAVGNKLIVSGPFSNSNGLQKTQWTYDGRSKVRSMTDTEGNVTGYKYDAVGNPIETIDARGQWANTTYEYDGANRMIKVRQPTGTESDSGSVAVTEMVYDPAGFLIKQIDPRGENFATEMSRDVRGNILSRKEIGGTESSPEDHLWTYEYDVAGFVTKMIDPRGSQYATLYQRDLAGRALEISHPVFAPGGPSRLSEFFEYDGAGNVLKQIGIGGSDYVTIMDYDARGRMTRRTDAVGEVQILTYDRFDNVLSKTDYLGTSLFEYDQLNRQTKAIDALNNVTRTEYEAGGLTMVVTTPRGNSTTTKHDRLMRVIEVVDPLGKKESTRYDAVGNAIEFIDKAGTKTTVEFDARNLITREVAAAGTPVQAITRHKYDLLGRKTATIDPRGEFYETTFEYDNRGRLIADRIAAGSQSIAGQGTPGEGNEIVRRWEYDSVGNLIAEVPERGEFYRREYTIDGLGRVLTMSRQVGTPEDAETVTEERRYNNAGAVISIKDELGFEATRTYDLVGRITSETIVGAGPGAGTTNIRYIDTLNGLRIEHTNRTGQVERAIDYDALGRIVTVDNLTGDDITNTYSQTLLQKVERGTHVTSYEYDELDRLKRETDQLEKSIEYTFDDVGNLKTVRDKENNVTSYEYDRLNRQRLVIDPRQGQTETSYDAAGHVIQIIDSSGNRTDLVVDALGRVQKETTSAGSRQFEYDPAGNIIRQVDRNGREIRRTWDGNNLLRTERWLNEQNTVNTIEVQYDAGGRKISSTDGDVTNTWSYFDNSAYWLAGSTVEFANLPRISIDYDRRATGEKTKVSVDIFGSPNVVENTYTYDESSLELERISQTGSFASDKSVEFSYKPNVHLVDRISRQSGGSTVSTTTYGFDSRNQVTSIQHSGPLSTINEYVISYNPNGMIESVRDQYDSIVFGYDSLKQLTSATHSDPDIPDEQYAMDLVGNRVNSTHHGESYAVNTDNRLTTDGVFNYQYDAEGNRTAAIEISTGKRTEYRWDHRNRLVEVEVQDSLGLAIARVSYAYDAENRRVLMKADMDLTDDQPSTTTRYVYEGDDVILELLDSNADDVIDTAEPHAVYLHGIGEDQILAQDFGDGDFQWLLADATGSITDVIATDGTLLDHIQYDSYGRIIHRLDPEVIVRYLFHGRPWQPISNTYYFRAREYDPALGLFLSVDPLSYGGGDTNQYRFALGNPVNFRDPSGLSVFGNPFQQGLAAMRDSLVQGDQAARNAFASTFIMGVYDSSIQTATALAANLPMVLATKIPVVGQVVGLAMAIKGSYDAYQKGEYWNAAKNFIPMLLGFRGVGAQIAGSFTVNTIDAGIAIKTGDPNLIAGALQGFAFDILDAKGKRLTIGDTYAKGGGGGYGDFPNLLKQGASLAKASFSEAMGIKSDIGMAISYNRYAQRQAAALKAGQLPVFDLLQAGFPQFKSGTFRMGSRMRSASLTLVGHLQGNPHSPHGDPNLRAHIESIVDSSMMARRRSQDVSAELIRLEQNLIRPSLEETRPLPTPSPLPTGALARGMAGLRAAGSELLGRNSPADIRARFVKRLEYNSTLDPTYYRAVSKVVDKVISSNAMTISQTGRRSLIESFIVMQMSTLISDPSGRAKTIWKDITAQKIKKQFTDVAERLEAFEYGQKYHTMELAQEALADTDRQYLRIHQSMSLPELNRRRDVLDRLVNGDASKDVEGYASFLKAKETLDMFSPIADGLIQMKNPHISAGEFEVVMNQVKSLDNLINNHRFSMPGPWNHLVRRLAEVRGSSDPGGEFLSILNTPFVTKETMHTMGEFLKGVNDGSVKMDSIDKGDLIAVLLRGTAGATLEQISTRANFVHQAFSGDITAIREQLARPDTRGEQSPIFTRAR